ncbi:class I SAM-dependent methyltransferase [Sabulicella glaciei]|uniref:Ubiquinone/menaquinone biosynthesis C-methyltransferase UbiE n=1 Tax=Sabulicella glaciei TaxID=2984948 RepID=A0ABT3NZ33_9PROT|nr:class I SAM-dependent methyltransferase [Roseococcus sp. MDT2-1-1]MCW8086844.1 class I SAM-dependent methyltransferase [Roseococcus sp. MDT2-1-1]
MKRDEAGAAPPHGVLRDYYADAPDRQRFVQDLFDRTAGAYDPINNALALGSGGWYRRQALRRAGLAPGMRLLDVAVGTGAVSREAVRILGRPGDVVGLDLSAGMLAVARRNLPIPLLQAEAEAIPLADASVDFVSMGYALRHAGDLRALFTEFRRVLRPGGRVLLLEIARPEGRLALRAARFWLGRVVPAASRLFGRRAALLMRYYWDTIEQCVPPAEILRHLREAGFAEVGCDVQLGVMRAYSARKPG